MKQINILLFLGLVIICASTVYALDKPLMNITDCYSINLTYNLRDGVATPISFVGCSDQGNNQFYCNCYSSDNKNFTLIMQTDGAVIRDERDYRIKLKVVRYNKYNDSADFDIKDWGDYVEFEDNDMDKLLYNNFNGKCSKDVQFVYVNKTTTVEVCTNKTPEYIDRPVDRPVYIQNITYIENTTKIDLLNDLITKKDKGAGTLWIAIIVLVLIILFLLYRLRQAGF